MLLQITDRRGASRQGTAAIVARQPALATRVRIPVGHEGVPRPRRRVPAVVGVHVGGAGEVGVVGGHGRGAGGDAGVEARADAVSLAVVPLFEPAAAEAQDQEADGDDYYHDDPFLYRMLAPKG